MGDHPHLAQAEPPGPADHVLHQPPPDARALGVVGDERQVQLRRIEHERVEAEEAPGGVDGHEHLMALDVLRAQPVAVDDGVVPAPVGAGRLYEGGQTVRVPCAGALDPRGLH